MSGEKLKSIIVNNGISLAELSRRLSISPQSVNQLLNAADVKSGFIEKVSLALGVSISSIYGEASSVSNITGNGYGVNAVNNDTDVIDRFLDIIEEKDKLIAQLIAKF